ncbi:MAG: GTP-binding protein [Candidatus Lokiarchaeota archaeon]
MPKSYLYKVLVTGNAGVGKTSLLRRYVQEKFDESTVMTIGVDFFVKELEINSGKCSLQLWDLGGQRRFRYMQKQYVMGARGALLLVDLTYKPKIDEIVEWVNIIRYYDINLPILLVGTKFDLEDLISVPDDFLLDIKDAFNMFDIYKTSAKTGHNVQKVFTKIAEKLVDNDNY